MESPARQRRGSAAGSWKWARTAQTQRALLAEVIRTVADAALPLDGALRALEVNPLWVTGDQVEALDVLVVTAAPVDPSGPAADNALF